jgi:hypothetical protein
MSKTAVVILNWNGKGFLEQFLPSVVGFSAEADVWVADNGSTDGSIDFLREHFPTVKLLCFDQNYGFAGGYNMALKAIDAEYFVLLNSDVEVTENWLAPLTDFMDANPDVAACAPKLLSYSQRTDFEYAGASGGFIDKYGYPFCRGRILGSIERDNGQYNDTRDVFWATGACLFVRSKLYSEAGGLDSDFFAHMEEIDLCWRLKNMGYRIAIVPQSTVYHVGGGTLPNNNPRKLFLNYRNNLFMLYKNLPDKKFRRTMITRMILDGLSTGLYLAKLQFGFLWAVLRAHIAFYKAIGTLRAKRKALQQKRKTQYHAECYNGSIVIGFYLRNKKLFSQLDSRKFGGK